jgi:hypothetical protein
MPRYCVVSAKPLLVFIGISVLVFSVGKSVGSYACFPSGCFPKKWKARKWKASVLSILVGEEIWKAEEEWFGS